MLFSPFRNTPWFFPVSTFSLKDIAAAPRPEKSICRGVEQQEHISGEEQHPLPDPGRNRGHDNEEFVKEGGRTAVREFVGYGAEQLAQGGIGGDTLAVAAGMDDQDAEVIEMAVAASDFFLFVDVTDHRQGSSAGAYTDTSLVRDHCEVGGCGKVIFPLLDLHPVAFRLVLIGGGQDDVIPHGEGLR